MGCLQNKELSCNSHPPTVSLTTGSRCSENFMTVQELWWWCPSLETQEQADGNGVTCRVANGSQASLRIPALASHLVHVFNFPLIGNISATPITAAVVTFHQEQGWPLTNWLSLLLTWVAMTLTRHEANTWRGLDSLLKEHLLQKMLKSCQ